MPKDINSATREELEQVPLISPTRAATIIDWRDSHGPIDDMTKLTEIPGIGERMVQRMAEHFSAGSGTGTPGEPDEAEENGSEDDENGDEEGENGDDGDEEVA